MPIALSSETVRFAIPGATSRLAEASLERAVIDEQRGGQPDDPPSAKPFLAVCLPGSFFIFTRFTPLRKLVNWLLMEIILLDDGKDSDAMIWCGNNPEIIANRPRRMRLGGL
jgi:hypothetical protein